MKTLLITLLTFFGLIGGLALPNPARNLSTNNVDQIQYLYEEDFENIQIVGSVPTSTVDKMTGIIFANNYTETNTVYRNGTNMLDFKVNDSNDYYIVGWIGGQGTLSKLVHGETYTFESYFEISGMSHIFIEYISDSWGSIILTSDGKIKGNAGHNMVDASYVDGVLKFSFTAAYCSQENANGYIKITTYASSNAKLYLDDLKIYCPEHVMNCGFEEYPLTDNWQCAEEQYLSKIYPNDSKTSIIGTESNHKLKVVSSSCNPTSGYNFMYINRLGFLQDGRRYTLSFDYEVTNMKELTIYYGGTWSYVPGNPSEFCYFTIDMTTHEVKELHKGDIDFEVSVTNSKITFEFTKVQAHIDPNQFSFIAKTIESGDLTLIMDNLIIDVEPIVNGIEIDDSNFKKTYLYGEELDLTNLKVYVVYTNGKRSLLNQDEYTISGFNSEVDGEQVLTITYLTYSKTILINVVRQPTKIEIDTTNVNCLLDYGQELDLTNLKVYVVYSATYKVEIGHGALIRGYSVNLNGFDNKIAGTYSISIIYLNFTESFNVTVNPAETVSFDDVSYTPTGA